MTTHTTHAGDRLTPISATLKQETSNGVFTARDLTGAAVTFRMKDKEDTVIVNDQSATVESASDGEVYYSPAAADVAVPGTYRCWFIVTAGGLYDTYPAEGDEYMTWIILP